MSNSKNIKDSKRDQDGACYNLTDSPYIGGNKMSSSLKERLKRFRRCLNPLARQTSAATVSTDFIPTSTQGQEFTKEEIEKTLNEPESDTCSHIQVIRQNSAVTSTKDLITISTQGQEFTTEEIEKALNEPEPGTWSHMQVISQNSAVTGTEDLKATSTQGQEFTEEEIEKALNEPKPDWSRIQVISQNSAVTDTEGFMATSNLGQEFTKEEIEKALNEPECEDLNLSYYGNESDVNVDDYSNTEDIDVVITRSDTSDNKIVSSDKNPGEALKKAFKEHDSDANEKICELQAGHSNGLEGNSLKIVKDKENVSKMARKISESDIEVILISSDEEMDNCEDKSLGEIRKNDSNRNYETYPMEVVENTSDHSLLFAIYHGMKKEVLDNEEKLRKLKLVQQHKNKNSPKALTALNQKWLTCAQSALRKLYESIPEPRSISFKDFLILFSVDLDAFKYSAETDNFS